jgi:RNA polymerase sigma-70 factor (ECF subfamily)
MLTFFRNTDRHKPAFETELYNRHYRRIYNTCLRIVGNSMDAEETMHDTFLKIFANIHKIKEEKAFYAWSQSIAIRTAIDRVRKKKPVFEPVENLAASMEEEPEEAAETTPWSVETIKSKLAELPDGYRIIISMRLFEGCGFEEIARALHIKESTVRSQFVRGRNKLAALVRASAEKQLTL